MSLFGFLNTYDDEQIIVLASTCIKESPVLGKYFDDIEIDSKKGIVKLGGKVNSQKLKDKIGQEIERKLRKSRIDFKDVENNIEVEADK